MERYIEGKWNSAYSIDKTPSGAINDKIIVFSFLRHIRNAVCHSGDDAALSVLPLSEGKIISEVLFYDKNMKRENEEFALRLSIWEVRKLIELIANFYRMPQIGDIDKTKAISKAEERAVRLLSSK